MKKENPETHKIKCSTMEVDHQRALSDRFCGLLSKDSQNIEGSDLRREI
jgi:hypothetical protein